MDLLDGKNIMIKNAILANNPMHNYKRSRPTCHKFELQIDFYTPMEKIVKLRLAILEYLQEFPKVCIGIAFQLAAMILTLLGVATRLIHLDYGVVEYA